jgi:oxygen-independent coproporphyrinogen-3 oxidase
MQKTLGLYIHVPFCATKCSFCALYSGAFSPMFHVKYFQNLFKEIQERSLSYKDYLVDTIYIGGGTPSFVDAQYIAEIINAIKSSYLLDPNAEISIEIDPESFNQTKFDTYTVTGINRFSIGIQAYDDETLTSLNRATRVKDIDNVISLLKKNNFNNYNLDIIYAFPNLMFKVLEKTLDYIIKADPTHVSAYNYSLEEPSLMALQIKNKKLVLPSTNIIKEQNEYVKKRLKSAGYIQYELSNYSKPGFECQHNYHFWQGKGYLGFGVSSVSYVDNAFIENGRDIKKYCDTGYLALQTVNRLSAKELDLKKMLLGLRLTQGLNVDFLFEQTEDLELQKFRKFLILNIQKQIGSKTLVLHETSNHKSLRVSDKGMKVFDFVCTQIIDI